MPSNHPQGDRVRRTALPVLALVIALIASLPVALAGAKGAETKLQLRKTSAGKILVDGKGYTLYSFTKDKRNQDACLAIHQCILGWPVLKASGKIVAGPGIKKSLIGTITIKHGVKQVTYAGHALYTYVGDSTPGETDNINIFQFKGRWPAINAAGGAVK
jgi:predicted lipoprotein with Yx(FWY)xxD motif